jgi:hypothetical protein
MMCCSMVMLDLHTVAYTQKSIIRNLESSNIHRPVWFRTIWFSPLTKKPLQCWKFSRNDEVKKMVQEWLQAQFCSGGISVTVCLALLWLQLEMTHYNTHQLPLCFCSGTAFRYLFCVLIYSTKLRRWNIHLNSRFFCTIRMWKIYHTKCVKDGFTLSILVFGLQFHQNFELVKKVHSTGSFLYKKYIRENTVLRKS